MDLWPLVNWYHWCAACGGAVSRGLLYSAGPETPPSEAVPEQGLFSVGPPVAPPSLLYQFIERPLVCGLWWGPKPAAFHDVCLPTLARRHPWGNWSGAGAGHHQWTHAAPGA
ncbi:hypothetical protein NDU88_005657 [Pleurodeles waltl]|uniref:Uncharacterized protein n=1 Tax=Pleurodeles waltl TaxID=8319 RepID=A0AAV7RPN7_PLEWA|nr:hypothetical protein NDU88_005657 [Pleurodeles waltl]